MLSISEGQKPFCSIDIYCCRIGQKKLKEYNWNETVVTETIAVVVVVVASKFSLLFSYFLGTFSKNRPFVNV